MNYKAITTYTLFVFLLTTLFGFLFMGTMNHETHGKCPFSVAGTLPCPEEGAIVTALHHIGMMDSFLAIILNSDLFSVSILMVFAVFLVACVPKILKLEKNSGHYTFIFKNYKKFHQEVFVAVVNFLTWLSRTKNLNSKESYNKAHIFVSV
ncbi:MAG: hypothetical protein WDZ40_02510 [Candidatus Spechtbacterales bacterium]